MKVVKEKVRILTILLISIVALAAAATALAALQPTYGVAVVDGDISEWDPEGDTCLDMLLAGGQGGQTEVLSQVCLRYDCMSKTIFVLVLAEPNTNIQVDAEEHWLKVNEKVVVDDQAGNDGTPPDFEWVGLSQDENNAQGWEASASVNEGTYNLVAHTLVWDGEEVQTSATEPNTLTIDCHTTVAELSSFTAQDEPKDSAPPWQVLLVAGGLASVVAFVAWRFPRPPTQ